jgi:hypothetical protein
MNKRISFPLSAALAAMLVVAASAAAMPLRFGLEGGPAFANMPGATNPVADLKSIHTLVGGLTVRAPLSPGLELQTGASYAVKGVSLGDGDRTDENGNVTGTFEDLVVSNQIEIPVLLRWTFPTAMPVHPYLTGGAFGSIELNEALKTTGDVKLSTATHWIKNSDAGLILGAGAEMRLGPGRWNIGARYEMGLLDVGYVTGSSATARSGLFAITTGYGF